MSDPDQGIPTTNTVRLVLNYEGVMGQRSLLFRFPPTTLPGDAIAAVDGFTDAVKGLWHESVTVTGGDYYPAGSAFSQPVTLAARQGTNTNTFNPSEYPRFMSVVGRDFAGTRVRYTLYGVPNVPVQSDYRLTQAEGGVFYGFRTALGTMVNTGDLITVQGSSPILNPYVNTGYNAYYQRKARRTL